VWDTDTRDPKGTGGCGGGPTALANQIQMSVSRDFGQTWSAPVTIAAPAGARVLWPWAIAADPGKVSVVWYQSDKVVDPDCATDAKWSIFEARLTGADSPGSMLQGTVNASGVAVHTGGVCQGGTACVATGKDRRLGDFFTNGLDARGCVLIASGDTRLKDSAGGPLPTARPILIRQTAGPALAGSGGCGAAQSGRDDSTYGDGTYGDYGRVLGSRTMNRAAGKKACSTRRAHRRAHRRARHHSKHRAAHRAAKKRSNCTTSRHKRHRHRAHRRRH
jgi:hypothetical protein